MYLELSAMHLLELHRANEAERQRENLAAARRALLLSLGGARRRSGEIGGISLGDRAGRRGDPCPDLGRSKDLDPATR